MIDPAQVFTMSVEPSAMGFESHWTVPAHLPYFDGHFPGNPVLPGVAIVDASLQCLRRALKNETLEAACIASAKFLGIITPETRVRIELTKMEGGDWLVRWTLEEESDRRLAELRIRF
jgi:3-hydroxymyristoyl/3-hydroxydecanoyl-(acyl carrier protein) dehydratase